MPSAREVRMTRRAISPRLAMSSLRIIAIPSRGEQDHAPERWPQVAQKTKDKRQKTKGKRSPPPFCLLSFVFCLLSSSFPATDAASHAEHTIIGSAFDH